MAKKSLEDSKIEAERKRKEIDRLRGEVERLISKIPERVVNGSHNLAVDYKAAVRKGASLLDKARPSAGSLSDCVTALLRFQ